MSKTADSAVTRSLPVTARVATDALTAAASTRHAPQVALQCGTCGATFATNDMLRAHLEDAYHGFQCLRCGALYARRDEHQCPWRLPALG